MRTPSSILPVVSRLLSPSAYELESAVSALQSGWAADRGVALLTAGDADVARLHWRRAVLTGLADGEVWVVREPAPGVGVGAGAGAGESDGGAMGKGADGAVAEDAADAQDAQGAGERDGKIVAVMTYYGPGVDYGSTPNHKGQQYVDATTAYPASGRAWFAKLHGAFDGLERAAYGGAGTVGTYHVSHLGTAAGSQGRGHAGRLVEAVVGRARHEGTTVTLVTQTPENVRFYSKYGLAVRAETDTEFRGVRMHWWAMSTAAPAAA